MSIVEVRELLELKGWDTARLASELGMTQGGVDRWFATDEKTKRRPSGMARKHMLRWLAEARQEAKVNGKRKDKVTA